MIKRTHTRTHNSLKTQLDLLVRTVGNIVHDSVPISQDEAKDQIVVKSFGEETGR
jgi:seryl-tRNA synthetase